MMLTCEKGLKVKLEEEIYIFKKLKLKQKGEGEDDGNLKMFVNQRHISCSLFLDLDKFVEQVDWFGY